MGLEHKRPYDHRFMESQVSEMWHTWATYQNGQQYDGLSTQLAAEMLFMMPDYVIYDDPWFIAVNKPSGIPSHSSNTNHPIGVEEAMKFTLPYNNPVLAHRIDMDTSGILLVGKTPEAGFSMRKTFGNKEEAGVRKAYLAIMDGVVEPPEGSDVLTVDVPLHIHNGTAKADPERKFPDSKDSRTIVRPLTTLQLCGKACTFAQIDIMTGRTHQIRAVAKHLGAPLVGDPKYNRGGTKAARLMLHHGLLVFTHPNTGEKVQISAPIHADMEKLLLQSATM